MNFFGKHDKKDEKPVVTGVSELEQICEGDKETYEALLQTMFLDPRKIDAPIKDAANNAKKFEKEKNPARARIWYDIARRTSHLSGKREKSDRILWRKPEDFKNAISNLEEH